MLVLCPPRTLTTSADHQKKLNSNSLLSGPALDLGFPYMPSSSPVGAPFPYSAQSQELEGEGLE